MTRDVISDPQPVFQVAQHFAEGDDAPDLVEHGLFVQPLQQ